MTERVTLREIDVHEVVRLWPIFQSVIAGGDTYSHASDTRFEQACEAWTTASSRRFVAKKNGNVLDAYLLKTNQPDFGNHLANAAHMITAHASGQGVASMTCQRSMDQARCTGFTAVQFTTWYP